MMRDSEKLQLLFLLDTYIANRDILREDTEGSTEHQILMRCGDIYMEVESESASENIWSAQARRMVAVHGVGKARVLAETSRNANGAGTVWYKFHDTVLREINRLGAGVGE